MFYKLILKISQSFSRIFVKRTVFFIVALFCYLYSLYTSDFAEMHIQFSFLDFPIFVGEILFSFCMIWMAGYFSGCREGVNFKVVAAIALYFFWVLVKAYLGYKFGGPLALRNAALFYYPVFFFVGYVIFDKNIFTGLFRSVLLVFLFFNLFLLRVNDYFVIAFFMLALGLVLRLRPRIFSLIGILLCMFYVGYSHVLWWNGRSHMVGIGGMVIFLAVYFLFGMLKARWQVKLVGLIFLAVLFLLVLFKFGDINMLRSMTTFYELRKQYQQLDAQIQRQQKGYVLRPLDVQIYHENIRTQKFRSMVSVSHNAKNFSTFTVSVEKPGLIKVPENVVPSILQKSPEKPSQEILQETSQGRFAKNLASTSVSSESPVTQITQPVKTISRSTIGSNQVQVKDNLNVKIKNIDEFFIQPVRKSETTTNSYRSLDIAYNNIFFRVFIWRDMIRDFVQQKAWFWGISFGQPQRSVSMEILDWAKTEWTRDGWITPHNSFVHMIYRGGLVGFVCVIFVFGGLVNMTMRFLKKRSIWGGFLIACLVYWVVVSNFLVFLELPHNAIFFWAFFGMTLAYLDSLENQIYHGKDSAG